MKKQKNYHMNKIKTTILAAGAAVMMVSCGGNGKKAEAGAPAEAAEKATLVATVTATRMEVPQTETYSTTVQAFAINNIAPQTGGRIQTIRADVGSFVGRGQVLATMDPAQLDQARLKLVNDSTELSRLRSLYEEGGVSKSDFDAAEMAFNVSRRSYNNLLENTYLRSPISGVVTARNYDRGDLYSGQPIFVVEQITPVKLLVGVSESDYTKVQKGQSVRITADALPGKEFSGTVNRLYPTMDPATHTFNVEVTVPNTRRELRPGMYARVTVNFGSTFNIVLPDTAVLKMQGAGTRSVFVVDPEGKAEMRVVTLGRHFDGKYEILSGLEEGEQVVVKGNSALKAGQAVQIG
jgi:RND family efflux transporter MFP subunit